MAEIMQMIPKTYDLILWLLLRLKRFPRELQFLLGDRIQSAALDVLCLLIETNYTCSRSNNIGFRSWLSVVNEDIVDAAD